MTRRISLVAVCWLSASVSSRVAGLQLREEPRVLDRDHRLVGEGLEQRDLSRAEGPHIGPVDRDGADRPAVAKQGDAERGPGLLTADGRGDLRILGLDFGEKVGQVDGPCLEDGPARHGLGRDRPRLADFEGALDAAAGDEAHCLPLDAEELGVLRLAQPGRVLDDGLEHRA